MVAALILMVLLAISVFTNFVQLISHALTFHRGFHALDAREVGPTLEECLLENNHSHNKIAVIPVEGIITSQSMDDSGNTMVDVIKAELDSAQADDSVKAVILKVNSPGGEVMAADEINKAIVAFQSEGRNDRNDDSGGRRVKPVICSMGTLAASGGYYISAPCRWVVANELTLTGSIGVIMEGFNYRGLMDKVGVEPVVYKSGRFKDMLSPFRSTNEIPPEEHAMVQNLINDTYDKFKSVVEQGRASAHLLNQDQGRELAADWVKDADGRVLSGRQALDLGLVDELGDFDAAVDRAEKIVHITNANLVEYRQKYDISNFLSMLGESSRANVVKLDVGIDLPRLQAGCLYFLWQPPGD